MRAARSSAEKIEARSIPEPNSGCWLWLGATSRNGRGQYYGMTTIGRGGGLASRPVRAHRLSYLTYVGPIPDGMYVCHRCDTPLCVNPDHLFLGTPKDNAADRDRKGRNSPAPVYHGEPHPSTRLSDAKVAEIRASTESSRTIARRLGLSDGYVRELRRGEWRAPTPPIRTP